jgi:Flp pilus assembly protein TadG
MGLKTTRRLPTGSAMVEMTLLMPLLAAMLFSIVEFGIAFQRWQVVTNAAREGARAAAVRLNGCAGTPVSSVVMTYVSAAGLGPGDVRIDVAPPSPCGLAAGTPVTVTVTHDFVLPVLSRLVPGLGGAIPLTGTSVMRKE